MDRLEKYIKEHLAEAPEVKPDMQMWANISTQLDQKKKQNIFLPLIWLLPGALVTANLLNLWYPDHNASDSKLATHGGYKVDTIYVERNIIVHDTIYQEKVVYKYEGIEPTNIFASPIKNGVELTKENELHHIDLSPDLPIEAAVSITSTQDVNYAGTIEEAGFDQNTKRENIHFAPLIAIASELLSQKNRSIKLPWHVKLRQHSSNKLEEILRPKAYFFGLGAGLTKVLSNANDFTLGTNINGELNIAFSRNTFLWANFSTSIDYFSSGKMDSTNGIPLLSPPTEAFDFILAESVLRSINVDLGLQYNFMKNNRIQPYLGFGVGLRKEYDYELQYDFENKLTGQVLSTERVIDHALIAYNMFCTRIGLCYHINKRFDLNGSLLYKNQWRDSNLLVNQMLYPQARLVYRIW